MSSSGLGVSIATNIPWGSVAMPSAIIDPPTTVRGVEMRRYIRAHALQQIQ